MGASFLRIGERFVPVYCLLLQLGNSLQNDLFWTVNTEAFHSELEYIFLFAQRDFVLKLLRPNALSACRALR